MGKSGQTHCCGKEGHVIYVFDLKDVEVFGVIF